jgi:hypothetical protein
MAISIQCEQCRRVINVIDTYAWLSIGCTLGLAIFKRAHELGLE